MLDGVTPFPAEFAARYRELGYWEDRPLFDGFTGALAAYADRVAVVDETGPVTYSQLSERSEHLARALLDHGLKPLDRVIVQLPNTAVFAYLYFALLRIGAAPVLALPGHRRREITQFAGISAAKALAGPTAARGFDFAAMAADVMAGRPDLRLCLIQGLDEAPNDPRFVRLEDLLSREPRSSREALDEISIDPADPALFLLSGGTTGIPKLIPRTHNDYLYNSKIASEVCAIGEHTVLLVILPIAHNLPLACPGIQGVLFNGGRVVLSTSARPEDVCALIEKHRVTHIKVVPALLIRLLHDPAVGRHDLSSLKIIQSGGQSMLPEVRLLSKKLIPSAFVQENFGMSEGLLMFVRLDDPLEVSQETVGRPVSPDDEVRLLDDDDREILGGEVGELCCRGPYTLRGYFGVPEYNARTFTSDGFYRSGDLMRRHKSGNYVVEGRKKDLINRGGEKISAEEIENLILSHPSVKNVACVPVSDPVLGERMCACVLLREHSSLAFEELKTFLLGKEIAKYKLPERLEIMQDFPLSPFGKVSKKTLTEMFSKPLAAEPAGREGATG